MNFTDEQIEIINAKETSFKINAVAGSGKTTTLLEYAKNKEDLKILYLAYNKSLQTELVEKAKKYKFKNFHISTIHAIAYNKIGAYNYNLTNELKTSVIESVLHNYEKINNQNNNYYPTLEYITLIKDMVNFYCNSSLIQLDEKLAENYKKYSDLGIKVLEFLNNDAKKALNHTKAILTSMKNKTIDATHDFYLKMFFLNKKISSNLGYDLILVDEAQDISDVMIGIVESQNANRIYIGDSHQQIYSFRYAINALRKIDLTSYNLSKSFRFSNEFAKRVEGDLNKLFKDSKLTIYGTENKTQIGENNIDFDKQVCIISRTTFGLIQEIVHYIHSNKKIYFEGGYTSYSFMNQTVYSIFYLKQKKHDKITLDEIKEFETIYELEEFAKDTKNQDYLNIIKFINVYGDNIFEINKKIKEKLVSKKEDANIIFTTTHKSKGLEYDQIIMANDFITKKEISNPKSNMSANRINEELNIYYVAATRGKKAVALSDLNLNYKYNENTDSSFVSNRFSNSSKTSQKKIKQLQEEWLKNNKIKKIKSV